MRKLRNQRNWTQDYLAGALQRSGLDISRSTLAKIEARMIRVPDHQMLYFARVFRVPYRELFPPVDPQDPRLYDIMQWLMRSRF